MPKNVRINPLTGELNYFFPLEISDDSMLAYAKFCGFEVGMARLGYRHFRAAFVPCKDKVIDSSGREVFIETSEEDQHKRYLEYIRDELREQDAAKQDGRCMISDGHGGCKRCPCRIPNPDYVPGGDQPKTLPVKCEGCKYEPFKQEHTFVPMSCLDRENEYGEMEPYDVPTPDGYNEWDRYERLSDGFVEFVREKKPEIADLADLLTQGYSRSEAARELGIPGNTAAYRREKLKKLCSEFLDMAIDI